MPNCQKYLFFYFVTSYLPSWNIFFRFVVLPSSTYLFTVGVGGFVFSLDHTQTHTTVGRTSLDEGSALRRDLYQTTQALYKRQTYMPPVGFESTIPAIARPQTYALYRAATEINQKFPNPWFHSSPTLTVLKSSDFLFCFSCPLAVTVGVFALERLMLLYVINRPCAVICMMKAAGEHQDRLCV
jgi:hypothetical protein